MATLATGLYLRSRVSRPELSVRTQLSTSHIVKAPPCYQITGTVNIKYLKLIMHRAYVAHRASESEQPRIVHLWYDSQILRRLNITQVAYVRKRICTDPITLMAIVQHRIVCSGLCYPWLYAKSQSLILIRSEALGCIYLALRQGHKADHASDRKDPPPLNNQ
jgi:hypothetical protein